MGPAADSVRGPAPGASSDSKSSSLESPKLERAADASGLGSTDLIAWGALPVAVAERVAKHLAPGAANVLKLGGDELDTDANTLRELTELSPDNLWILIDVGQQPTKDVLRVLREIRQTLAAQTMLNIVLVEHDGTSPIADADPREIEIWRRAISQLEDPYLGIERLPNLSIEQSP